MVTDMERREIMKYLEPNMDVITFDKRHMITTLYESEEAGESGGNSTDIPEDMWD